MDRKIIYCDLGGFLFSATGTDAGYPLVNLQNYFASTQWKAAGTSVPQYLNIDIGAELAAVGIDSVVLENATFSELGGAIMLEAADDAAYSSGLVTVVADLHDGSGKTLHTFTLVQKQYWRIKFATSLSSAPTLGQIFLGKALTLPATAFEGPERRADPKFETSKIRTINGQLFTAQLYTGVMTFDLIFAMLSESFRADYSAFIRAVRGGLTPYYFVDSDGMIYYLLLVADYSPLNISAYNQAALQALPMEAQLAL